MRVLFILFFMFVALWSHDALAGGSEPSQAVSSTESSKGESSSFTDYLNETVSDNDEEPIILYEDYTGTKVEIDGSDDNVGPKLKVPY